MGKYNYNYVVKYFTYNGKTHKVYGKTLEEVLEKKVMLLHDLKEKEVKKSTVTVRAWTETALETYKPNVSLDYLAQMQGRIGKHILTAIGDKRIQDVTPLECQKILNAQAGASASHIKKLRQELYFIFDTARKNGLIKSNPCEDTVMPSGTAGKRRSLTPDERKHFLSVCKAHTEYLLFELMFYCGLRSSEAIRLKYEDIVTIQGVKCFHVRGTKTAAADRFVPVPPELHLGDGSGNIALTAQGVPFTKDSYRRASDHLRRDMNISMGCKVFRNQLVPPFPLADDFVPYMLRHTFCTDLKKKGVDIRLAKTLMGHSDIKMTADIYDHADDESIILAAEQMGYVDKNVDKTP